MTTPWKVLVVSLLIYVVLLTVCAVKMVTYLQWLHFEDDRFYDTLSATAPGLQTALILGIGAGVLVLVNLVVGYRAFARSHASPPQP